MEYCTNVSTNFCAFCILVLIDLDIVITVCYCVGTNILQVVILLAITEAQRKAHDKYFSKAYSQVKLSMPNDEAAALRQYCSDHGLTVAGFIRGLVRDAIAAGVQATPVGDMTDTAGAGVSSPNTRE